MKYIRVIAVLVTLTAIGIGCSGCACMLGLLCFGGAAVEVLHPVHSGPASAVPTVAYDHGISADTSLDYHYVQNEDPTSADRMGHQDVEFSEGTRESLLVGLRKCVTNEPGLLYFEPIVGYTRREYEVEVDGDTQTGENEVWLVGVEYGGTLPWAAWTWNFRYLYGRGDIDIPQLDDTPPFPGSNADIMDCSQISGEVCYSLFRFCQLSTGIALDTVCLPNEAYLSDAVLGGRNAYRVATWTLGCKISHDF